MAVDVFTATVFFLAGREIKTVAVKTSMKRLGNRSDKIKNYNECGRYYAIASDPTDLIYSKTS